MRLVYDMVSLTDEETTRLLDDVVLLATHANPDGHALVVDWYMRHDDPMERSTGGVPVLYEKYAGHDNNRDFFMVNLPETRNMNRVAYTEWYPQIVYNHHQTGPQGTVMFAPPFRGPPNHNLDPLILTSLDQVGSAMHQRFVVEGKGGTTMRGGASYSTWWNGGLRTAPYFHNMIGLLTETIGNPTPQEVPFLPARQITSGDLPLPVEPGPWHFMQSVEYSQTANRAVLDYASRNKDHLLFNIWRMAMNSIERGSRDHWTVLPREIAVAAEAMNRGSRADWERLLRDPEDRDARGYILPRDQADFNTAVKFVNTLLMNGVRVRRATADFTVSGVRYPAGSLVVKTDQAFRPHVLDMFEPQDHPNDFAYPGAPPTPPYDATGWTLAYTMGVDFDRVLDGFDGPFEEIDAFMLDMEPGEVTGTAAPAGYLVDHRINDAFIVVNRVLKGGGEVFWMKEPVSEGGSSFPAGAFFVPAASLDAGAAAAMAREVGVGLHGVTARPAGGALELHPVRIGLWDRYGGSMPSGWTRYILEHFEFDYEVVFPPELDRGDLNASYDVLLFPDGAIPGLPGEGSGGRGGGFGSGADGPVVPAEYQDRLGSVTAETTVPRILDFIRSGGAAVAVGSSTSLAYHAGLPVANHLTGPDGSPLRTNDYYIPGSVMELRLDDASPVTHGMGDRVDVLFDRSPVFRVEPGVPGVRPLGWFDSDAPLRSGWAWGQEHLEGGAALLEADLGQGKLFLFGPEVTFRGQPHGTFPLVFNAIYYGTARDVPITEPPDGS
jgi:hypothetical protein